MMMMMMMMLFDDQSGKVHLTPRKCFHQWSTELHLYDHDDDDDEDGDDDDEDGDDEDEDENGQFYQEYEYDDDGDDDGGDDDSKVYLTPRKGFPQGSLSDSVSTLSLHHLFHFQFMDSQQIHRSTPSSSPQS